jgi:putative transposase
VPQAQHQRRDLLEMESQVRRDGGLRRPAADPLEDENAKLKKLLAEAMLDYAMLRDVTARKW